MQITSVFCYERVQPVTTKVVSVVGKTSQPKYKNLTTPQVGPKKTMSVVAFRIALIIDVKIAWFVCQVAVCVKKQHQNAIFGCS